MIRSNFNNFYENNDLKGIFFEINLLFHPLFELRLLKSLNKKLEKVKIKNSFYRRIEWEFSLRFYTELNYFNNFYENNNIEMNISKITGSIIPPLIKANIIKIVK